MLAQGGKSLQLTFTMEAKDSDPKFSPDGKFIAFNRNINGVKNIWYMKINLEEIKRELKFSTRIVSFKPFYRRTYL